MAIGAGENFPLECFLLLLFQYLRITKVMEYRNYMIRACAVMNSSRIIKQDFQLLSLGL